MEIQQALEMFRKDNFNYYDKSTLRQHCYRIRRFLIYTGKDRIGDITSVNVENFFLYLIKTGIKNSTRNNYLKSLKSFFKYMVEEDYCTESPVTVKRFPEEDKIVRVISPFELFKFKEVIKDNLRDLAIVDTLYYTGVRITELVNIRIEDVNFDKRRIWIRETKDLQPRYAFFKPPCGISISKYLASRNDDNPFLFITSYGNRFSDGGAGILLNFENYSQQAGIEKITPHMFRRTFATNLYENGAPVEKISQLLGHNSLAQTYKYIKASPKIKRERYDKHY